MSKEGKFEYKSRLLEGLITNLLLKADVRLGELTVSSLVTASRLTTCLVPSSTRSCWSGPG